MCRLLSRFSWWQFKTCSHFSLAAKGPAFVLPLLAMVTCKETHALIVALHKRGFTGKDIAASKTNKNKIIYQIIMIFKERGSIIVTKASGAQESPASVHYCGNFGGCGPRPRARLKQEAQGILGCMVLLNSGVSPTYHNTEVVDSRVRSDLWGLTVSLSLKEQRF